MGFSRGTFPILSRHPNLFRKPSTTQGGTDPLFEKKDG